MQIPVEMQTKTGLRYAYEHATESKSILHCKEIKAGNANGSKFSSNEVGDQESNQVSQVKSMRMRMCNASQGDEINIRQEMQNQTWETWNRWHAIWLRMHRKHWQTIHPLQVRGLLQVQQLCQCAQSIAQMWTEERKARQVATVRERLSFAQQIDSTFARWQWREAQRLGRLIGRSC